VLTDCELEAELLAMTDRYTDERATRSDEVQSVMTTILTRLAEWTAAGKSTPSV
jgi:hypothetical protein